MEDQSQFNSLDGSYYKVMIIKRLLFFLILVAVFLGLYFMNRIEGLKGLLFYLIAAGLVVLGILLFVMAGVFFRRKKYRLFDKNLTYQEGVLIHKETVVPFSRIQHVEIDEGPLERFFSLATLSVYTAGDSGKDLKINGLRLDKAQEIKDFITNYIKDE